MGSNLGATLALVFKQNPSENDRYHNVRLAWGMFVPPWAEKYEDRFGHPIFGSVEAGVPIVQLARGSPGLVVKFYSAILSELQMMMISRILRMSQEIYL